MKQIKRRDWLIELRNSKGLTQEEAAKMSGIERSTYTKAENGSTVGVKTAKKIADTFGFDWTLFFEVDCDEKEQNTA